VSLYAPVSDSEPENTVETHELGSVEEGETKVEYLNLDNVRTPDNTEIGAVGGSDPILNNKSRSFKLRVSRLARLREPSAASHTELIDRAAASSSISQQPEPSALPLND